MRNQSEINSKITEVVTLLTDVFTHTLKTKGILETQFVTDEVLRVLEFNGITFMRDTHPAIDRVFANLDSVATLLASNAFGYNPKN